MTDQAVPVELGHGFSSSSSTCPGESNKRKHVKTMRWDQESDETMAAKRTPYPGSPPPGLPEQGDPAGHAKIKAEGNLKSYSRIAEMAAEFFNKNNPDADYEVVEVISGYKAFDGVLWSHINFKAKPKGASADECNDQSLQTFFAEWFVDDIAHKASEGVITACFLLQEGSTKDWCRLCYPLLNINHPPRGFLAGFDILGGEDCFAGGLTGKGASEWKGRVVWV